MILDTSAVVAILRREEEGPRFAELVAGAGRVAISAANVFEAAMVLEGKGATVPITGLDELLNRMDVEIAPVTAETAWRARDAWRRYGKGRNHPADLNFGDCFAYALAQERGEPLLFKGNDFARTDVTPAL